MKPVRKAQNLPPLPAPKPLPAPDASQLEQSAKALREKTATWMHADSDPRQDVCNARTVVRIETHHWPTVLTLSPTVFEDLVNHPSSLDHIAKLQADRSYDISHPVMLARLLAPLYGVKEIRVNEAEPAASLS